MKYTILLAALCVSLFISGCCESRKCATDRRGVLQIEGFTQSELTMITLVRYAKGDNFTTPLETTQSTFNNKPFEGTAKVPVYSLYLDYNNEYVVKIPAADREYRINNFVVQTNKCSKCLGKRNNTYDRLAHYDVNGVTQHVNTEEDFRQSGSIGSTNGISYINLRK